MSYENTTVQNILSAEAFDAYRVVGADGTSATWEYTNNEGTVIPLAITTGASATKTAQGLWVTPAILLGGHSAVMIELDASSTVVLGTILVAVDDGKVVDITTAIGLLEDSVVLNNVCALSLVEKETGAGESDILTATTNIPFGALTDYFTEGS